MQNEKRKNKKGLLLILLAFLLVTVVASGTIAWLTQTSTLTNSFTVGTFEDPTTSPTDPSQTIQLDGNLYEPSWDSSVEHKLIPGVSYSKDPYVGIGAGSEDAIVYVYVKNNFSNKVYFTLNNGWEAVEATDGYAQGTYTSGLFKYTLGLSDAEDADVWTAQPIFSSVVADETALISDFTVAEGTNSEIVISSFIHQKYDGDGNAIDEATILAAAKDAFGIA